MEKISLLFSVYSYTLCLTEEVGDEGEEEKECITYNISIDIHYGIKSNRYLINKMAFQQHSVFIWVLQSVAGKCFNIPYLFAAWL